MTLAYSKSFVHSMFPTIRPILPTNERMVLLREYGHGNGRGPQQRVRTFVHRMLGSIRGELNVDEPSWAPSRYYFLSGSWIDLLVVFIPFSLLSGILKWDVAFRFTSSAIAIIPLTRLLGEVIDRLCLKLNRTFGGVLKSSSKNVVIIIISIMALLKNKPDIVQASLLGSALCDILLILGCSFLAEGIKFPERVSFIPGTQVAASMMILSCITLIVPAGYSVTLRESGNKSEDGLLTVSRGTVLVLLLIYVTYIFFQLKTHTFLFEERHLAGQQVIEQEMEVRQMSIPATTSSLVLTTMVTSLCANYLVELIDEVAVRWHVTKAFIALIILPIVASAPDYVTSVWTASKHEMDLIVDICIGSSVHMIAFVIPLLFMVGWITDHPLTVVFSIFQITVLFISAILVKLIVTNGKLNHMIGIVFLVIYAIVALIMWVS